MESFFTKLNKLLLLAVLGLGVLIVGTLVKKDQSKDLVLDEKLSQPDKGALAPDSAHASDNDYEACSTTGSSSSTK